MNKIWASVPHALDQMRWDATPQSLQRCQIRQNLFHVTLLVSQEAGKCVLQGKQHPFPHGQICTMTTNTLKISVFSRISCLQSHSVFSRAKDIPCIIFHIGVSLTSIFNRLLDLTQCITFEKSCRSHRTNGWVYFYSWLELFQKLLLTYKHYYHGSGWCVRPGTPCRSSIGTCWRSFGWQFSVCQLTGRRAM